MHPVHGNGRCHSVHGVIQGGATLLFRKETLSDQHSELGVAQPHSWEIRARTAASRHYIQTHYPVFAGITLRKSREPV